MLERCVFGGGCLRGSVLTCVFDCWWGCLASCLLRAKCDSLSGFVFFTRGRRLRSG
jgi:hypothetical protein